MRCFTIVVDTSVVASVIKLLFINSLKILTEGLCEQVVKYQLLRMRLGNA
ncbi:hypothetical protein M2R47_00015 [Moraxella sp. Tifton1]|nr:hypothetical protein [Moraxella sp. Tifton1]MCL1622642.1 hypothetical protein [Moraxella sp. Tifton1]